MIAQKVNLHSSFKKTEGNDVDGGCSNQQKCMDMHLNRYLPFVFKPKFRKPKARMNHPPVRKVDLSIDVRPLWACSEPLMPALQSDIMWRYTIAICYNVDMCWTNAFHAKESMVVAPRGQALTSPSGTPYATWTFGIWFKCEQPFVSSILLSSHLGITVSEKRLITSLCQLCYS